MALRFDDLRVLQAAEGLADDLWKVVLGWDEFTRDVVGRQLAKAADSIGANIAESFGRYHYGEKLQFLYYARGSLFETKYWINRASARELIQSEQASVYSQNLNDIARQINGFSQMIRGQKRAVKPNTLAESQTSYILDLPEIDADPIFDSHDLEALLSNTLPLPDYQYPISNT